MATQMVTEIVKIEELRAYLAQHNLRVIKGGWRFGEKRPWLITGPALPAEANTDEGKGDQSNEQ